MLKSRNIPWITFSNGTLLKEKMKEMHSVKFIEIIHSLHSTSSTEEMNSHTILFPSQFLLNQFRKQHGEGGNHHVLYFGLNEEKWKGTLSSNVDRTVSYIISNKDREVDELFKKFKFKNEQIYFIFNQENTFMYNVIQKEFPNSISILIPSRMDENFKWKKLLLYLSFTNFFFISKNTESEWIFRAMALHSIPIGEWNPWREEIILENGFLVKQGMEKEIMERMNSMDIQKYKKNSRVLIEESFNQMEMVETFLKIINQSND
jgi:hypothetical protein